MHASNRNAVTLMELMAVVAIVGIAAAVIIPRVGAHHDQSKTSACEMNRVEIELQCQLYRRATGDFPASAAAIGANTTYFPDGLPTCPVDGSAYTIDASTGLVVRHNH